MKKVIPGTSKHWLYHKDLLVFCLRFRRSPVYEYLNYYYHITDDYYNIYISIYIHIRIYVYIHVYIHIYVYIDRYIHTYISISIYLSIYLSIHLSIYLSIYIYIHIDIYIYILYANTVQKVGKPTVNESNQSHTNMQYSML